MTDYAAIFIGGGNTYHLLQRLKNSGAFQQIKDYLANGGVVYGGERLPDVVVGEHNEHRVWINTKK